MKKEFAFQAFDIYGNRSYWAASYPTKYAATIAAKEYVSNYPGRTAKILENTNARGGYTNPIWVFIANFES